MRLSPEQCPKLLEEIKKEMKRRESETNLKYWHNDPHNYVQYMPTNAGVDWDTGKYHYEFLIRTNFIKICFHCEERVDYSERKRFGTLIKNDSSLGSMSWDWKKMPNCTVDYGIVNYDEGNLERIAKDAAEKMIEFEKKYGDKILGYVKESKNPIKVESVLPVTKENTMTEHENPYVKLLLNNHNIILHGAPGTGKTYLAKEIAKAMGCSDDEIGFVQFHQSYDYTDFVEGLRPTNQENGQIGFERKDGVFKAFCAKAIKMQETNESNDFDTSWEKLLDEIRNGIANNNLVKIGSWEYGLSKVNSLKYSSLNSPSQYTFTITKKNVYDVYAGRKARPSGAFQKDMQDVVDYMKQKIGLGEYKPMLNQQDNDKKYVFIIDEINRGEMSKIFGELFFSIDPGYRVKFEDLKKLGLTTIRTQYANLQEEANEFDEALGISDVDNYGHFFVPENVYIIGTMNDIDRSVESMDFAMRRRFAFKEIKASDRAEDMFKELGANKDEAVKRMNALNASIEKIPGLSTAYHIGPAYFLKLNNYEGDFEQLWTNHIECLLREYLRGMDKVEEKIENLKNAYNTGVATESGESQE